MDFPPFPLPYFGVGPSGAQHGISDDDDSDEDKEDEYASDDGDGDDDGGEIQFDILLHFGTCSMDLFLILFMYIIILLWVV